MALQRVLIDGYGQLELNNVSFDRTGRSESQCRLAKSFTKTAPCEVGMLLAVDKTKREVRLPQSGEKLPIALNYSTEKQYDNMNPGLKNFYQFNGGDYDTPRMGYLSTGEIFTSNCLARNDTEFDSDETLKTALDSITTTPIYGQYCEKGAIQLVKTEPTTLPYLKVVAKTTMPDGQFAVKFQVVKA